MERPGPPKLTFIRPWPPCVPLVMPMQESEKNYFNMLQLQALWKQGGWGASAPTFLERN